MAINKLSRSYWSPINISKHSFLTKERPNRTQIHVKTPNAKLAKIYTKCFGYMTKMTAMPIYGKNSLKIFLFITRRPVTLELGI